MKSQDSPPAAISAASRRWAVVLVAGLSDRVTRLVRRPSPPQASIRTLFEEATLGLESIQDAFDASLRDLDAANWEELSIQLDRVNDLLRSAVEEVIGRRAPPREHR